MLKPYTRLEKAYFGALVLMLLLSGSLAAMGELWAVTDSVLLLVLLGQAHSDVGHRQRTAQLERLNRRLSEAIIATEERLRLARSSGEHLPLDESAKAVHLVSSDWQEDGALAKTLCCGRYLSHFDGVAITCTPAARTCAG